MFTHFLIVKLSRSVALTKAYHNHSKESKEAYSYHMNKIQLVLVNLMLICERLLVSCFNVHSGHDVYEETDEVTENHSYHRILCQSRSLS